MTFSAPQRRSVSASQPANPLASTDLISQLYTLETVLLRVKRLELGDGLPDLIGCL
jgi:hypothetical protein